MPAMIPNWTGPSQDISSNITVGIMLSWYAVPDVALRGPFKLFHFSFIGPQNNFGTVIVLSARFNHILKSFPAWC